MSIANKIEYISNVELAAKAVVDSIGSGFDVVPKVSTLASVINNDGSADK